MKNTLCKKCEGPMRFRGRQWVCSPCHKVYAKAWRAKNSERIKEKAKAVYAKNKERLKPYHKAYYAANVTKIKQYKKDLWRSDLEANRRKDRARKRRTNLAEITLLEKKQLGVCAICLRSNGEKALCLDHNHATNAVRGLLCNGCNVGIGMFKDSPDLLRAAIVYLTETEGLRLCP